MKAPGEFTWTCDTGYKHPRGWRQRLAFALRRLASRLDGRWTLAVRIDSDPPLTPTQQHQCILAGVKAMHRAVHGEVQLEAQDELLSHLLPRLWERTR